MSDPVLPSLCPSRGRILHQLLIYPLRCHVHILVIKANLNRLALVLETLNQKLRLLKLKLQHQVDRKVRSLIPQKRITVATTAAMLENKVTDFMGDKKKKLLVSHLVIKIKVEDDST